MEVTAGLRERKKQRTREAIVEAAFELFEERGFEGTTIADIAEAAEIAPRTFFSYFPSKDDVVFYDFEEGMEMVTGWFRDREPGTTAIDALQTCIGDISESAGAEKLRKKRLRNRLVRETESLAAHAEHLRGKVEEVLAEAIAEDLGDAPGDVRPRLAAAATGAAFEVLDDLPLAHSDETIDSLFTFLRGGLAAMQEQSGRAGE